MDCLKNTIKWLLIIYIGVSTTPTIYGQKAETFKNWLHSVEREFPELENATLRSLPRSGSPRYNKIRFNLLSDRYFIPIFKKSYSELSTKKKSSIGKKIRDFKQKRSLISKEEKYPWAKRLEWYMWGALDDERLSGRITKEVDRLRATRKTYEQQMRTLQSGNIDYKTLSYESQLIDQFYGTLLPSEIKEIKALSEQQTQIIASKSLEQKVEEIKTLEPIYSNLYKFDKFLKNESALFKKSDVDTASRARKAVEQLIAQTLDTTISNETKDLSTFSIERLNSFSDDFTSRYNAFRTYDQVVMVTKSISDLKAQKVQDIMHDIDFKIESAQSNDRLNALEKTYVAHINPNDHPGIQSISQMVAARKIALKEERRQRLELKAWKAEQAEIAALAKFDLVLKMDGLENKDLFDNILKGYFVEIPFNRNDAQFSTFITQYMYVKARSCPETSPADRTEILERVCAGETVYKDGYGFETSRHCSSWTNKRTGLYTSKVLYAGHNEIRALQSSEIVSSLGKLIVDIGKGEGLNNMTNMVNKSISIKKDMINLFALNSCSYGALDRFEINLLNFAYNRPPIKVDGSTEKLEVNYSEKQDINRLVGDLVLANSKEWAGQYVRNSLKNIKVVSKDTRNRPTKITASYQFTGILGTQNDKIVIRFTNGVPTCIDFPNYSMYCKTPDRKIVAKFTKGVYVLD